VTALIWTTDSRGDPKAPARSNIRLKQAGHQSFNTALLLEAAGQYFKQSVDLAPVIVNMLRQPD
jgi:hypothetical protein